VVGLLLRFSSHLALSLHSSNELGNFYHADSTTNIGFVVAAAAAATVIV